MNYRREIDGLRALAVMPVILFHAGFETFKGGFVGVDVFFVISGYLITAIIMEDIKNNRFSIVNFYERRIRRILPALLAVFVFTCAVSWFYFLPEPNKVVGQYTAASIFSSTNLLLYLKGQDYFGLEDSKNPLFHTWSLSVEEQYYVIVPVLMILLWSPKKVHQLTLVASIIVLSFAILIYKIDDPTFNFYMVFSRAWELGAGALAAVLKSNYRIQANPILAFLGLAILVWSVLGIHKDNALLSVYLIFPVLGSFLIVLFASADNFAGRFLSLRPMVLIGLLSYSLYLWHIPLIVYFRYFLGDIDQYFVLYFIVLASFSYLSYKFVESPFRNRKLISTSTMLAILTGVSLPLMAFGVGGHLSGGFPDRSPIFTNLQNNNGWGPGCNGNSEVTTNCSSSNEPKVAVLGNSYAMALVKPLLATYDRGVVQLTQYSCAVGYIDKVKEWNSIPCGEFYSQSVNTIKEKPSIEFVVISSPFDREIADIDFSSSFVELLSHLEGKKVLIVGPTPQAPFNVGECVVKRNLLGIGKTCDFEVSDQHLSKVAALRQLIEPLGNVYFFDVTDLICPNNICKMELGRDSSIYIDTGHLSLDGGMKTVNELIGKFDIRQPLSASRPAIGYDRNENPAGTKRGSDTSG